MAILSKLAYLKGDCTTLFSLALTAKPTVSANLPLLKKLVQFSATVLSNMDDTYVFFLLFGYTLRKAIIIVSTTVDNFHCFSCYDAVFIHFPQARFI